MSVEQAGMVRMIRGLPGQLAGRNRSTDDLPGGRTQRVEIWPVEILPADVEHGERLAIDLDRDLLRSLRDCDLCVNRRRNAQRDRREECEALRASSCHIHVHHVEIPKSRSKRR
jgi:hypothetical protein